MQLQVTSIPSGTIFATFLGVLAAAIVWLTLAGTPPFGSERPALVALVVVGVGMCVGGGWGATGQFPTGPAAVIGSLAGVLTLVTLAAVIFGWTAVLDPLAGVVYGQASAQVADKIGVVTVGVLIAIAWFASTLRQVGVLSSTAG